jgi:hypothetical protein
VTEKDLYRTILSVLQSHFDSTEAPRQAADLENVATVAQSGEANRALQAHRIGLDAMSDWLSAKLSPGRLEIVGMTRD